MVVRAATALPIVVVVAVDPAGWYPFGPAKWAAVTVTVAVLTIGLVRRPELQLPAGAMALWAVLLLTGVIAAATAVDDRYSWLGTPERHFGLLTWVLLGVCFVAGAQLAPGDVRIVGRGGAVAALWLGMYSLVELWWGAPVDVAGTTSRLGGPFGSAAYLGAACCLLVPIAAGTALDRMAPVGWRVMGAAGALTAAVALVGSGARAAWFGAVVGVVVVAVASRRRAVLLAATGLAIVGLALVVARVPDIVEREHGAASRVDEWRLAAQVVVDHPVLGVGPEGYRVAVADAVDPGYERRYGRAVVPDRAHSGPLDVAATLGVPAVFVLFVLLGLVVAACWRWAREGPVRAGVATGVVAYFAGQLLLFPIAELDPLAWLLAGAAVGDAAGRIVTVRLPARRALVGASVVLLAGAFAFGVTDVAADRLAARAADGLGDPRAVADARRAAELRPDVFRLHLLEAAAAEATGTLAGVDEAIAAVATAARWTPDDPVVRRRGAEYLLRRAEITGGSQDIGAALVAWEGVVDGDRYCFECQLGLGRAAALAGDVPRARDAWQAAAALTDGDPRPRQLLAALDEMAP